MKTIRTPEYIAIAAEYGTGSVELECWPDEAGNHGPVFFRYHSKYGSNTQGTKLHTEAWETFFSRIEDGFELKPIMRELAESL